MYLCIKMWYYKQHNEYPGRAKRVAALEDESNLTIVHIQEVVDMYWKGRYKYLPNLNDNKRRMILNTIQMLTKLHAISIRDGMNRFLQRELLIVDDDDEEEEEVKVRHNITQSTEFMEGLHQLSDAVENTKGHTWLKLNAESQKKGSKGSEKQQIQDSSKKKSSHYPSHPDKPNKNIKRKHDNDNDDNTSAKSTIASEDNRSKKARKQFQQNLISSDTAVQDELDNIEEWGVTKEIYDTSVDSTIDKIVIEESAAGSEPVTTENQPFHAFISTVPVASEIHPAKEKEKQVVVETLINTWYDLQLLLIKNNMDDEYVDEENEEEESRRVEDVESDKVEENDKVAEVVVEEEESEDDEEIKKATELMEKLKKYEQDFQKLLKVAEANVEKLRRKKKNSRCK